MNNERQAELRSRLLCEIDLELSMKFNEVRFLCHEIDRLNRMMEPFSQLLYYDNLLKDEVVLPVPEHQADILFDIKGRKLEQTFQYERKADGTYVRLVCPLCGRDKFGNILGVKNHCRIKHDLILHTAEERIAKCGIPVAESEIPNHYILENINNFQTIVKAHDMLDPSFVPEIIEEHRFFYRRKVIIGNVSMKIGHEDGLTRQRRRSSLDLPPSLQPPSHSPSYSHKWKIYITGPPEDFYLDKFIRKVRFVFHESYAPDHIIDVTNSPFAISKYAWAESLVLVKLYFWEFEDQDPTGPAQNIPPAELNHQIFFGRARFNNYSRGKENEHWIDVPKEALFIERPLPDSQPRLFRVTEETFENQDHHEKLIINVASVEPSDCDSSLDSSSTSESDLQSPPELPKADSRRLVPNIYFKSTNRYKRRKNPPTVFNTSNGISSSVNLSGFEPLIMLPPFEILYQTPFQYCMLLLAVFSSFIKDQELTMAEEAFMRPLMSSTHPQPDSCLSPFLAAYNIEWRKAKQLQQIIFNYCRLFMNELPEGLYVLVSLDGSYQSRKAAPQTLSGHGFALITQELRTKFILYQSRSIKHVKIPGPFVNSAHMKAFPVDIDCKRVHHIEPQLELPNGAFRERLRFCRFCGRWIYPDPQRYIHHLKKCQLKPIFQDICSVLNSSKVAFDATECLGRRYRYRGVSHDAFYSVDPLWVWKHLNVSFRLYFPISSICLFPHGPFYRILNYALIRFLEDLLGTSILFCHQSSTHSKSLFKSTSATKMASGKAFHMVTPIHIAKAIHHLGFEFLDRTIL